MWARVGFIGLALGIGTALPLLGGVGLEAQERPRLAVLPFENRTDWWGRDLGQSAASQLTVGLVNSGAFAVLERQRVDAVYEEWAMGQSGAVSAEQAVEIGRLLGAEYLVTGQFTHFNISERGGRVNIGGRRVGASETRAESAMNVRVFSAATGEIVAAAQAEGSEVLGRGLNTAEFQTTSRTQYNRTVADQALGPAIEQIVAELASQRDRFPTTAPPPVETPSIAGLAEDGSVYIDQGENSGITEGQRFQVMRVVDVIQDRDGNVLDEVTERVGIIEVSRVLSQSAVCTVVEGEADVDDRLQVADGG
jgi:curli biogenesis system outer membrane secretion channel CsgG